MKNPQTLYENKWSDFNPEYALVLGSGWGDVVDIFDIKDTISYQDLAVLAGNQIEGHSGQLSWGEISGKTVLLFEGRKHYYEKLGWTPIAAPVYFTKSLGADKLILTNACGGIAEHLKPGNLMLITDHINCMGDSPLRGEHHEFWGPQFVDLTYVYDNEMREQLSPGSR